MAVIVGRCWWKRPACGQGSRSIPGRYSPVSGSRLSVGSASRSTGSTRRSPAHVIEFGIDPLHLLDAPAHQDRRSHHSQANANTGGICQPPIFRRPPITTRNAPINARASSAEIMSSARPTCKAPLRPARRHKTATDAEQPTTEQAALGADQRRNDFIAKSLAQHRAQIADRVDQAEVRAPAGRSNIRRRTSRFPGR